jgi:hypothetical protein
MRTIGVLMPGVATEPDRQGWAAAFVQTLHNLGWEEGKNIRIETRWNASDAERAHVLFMRASSRDLHRRLDRSFGTRSLSRHGSLKHTVERSHGTER